MRSLRLVRALGILLPLIAAGATVAHAQTGKLSGVVTDAQTGAPLEGVQVVVQGTGQGSMTNASGRYFLLNVQPGMYVVTARRLGYQSQEVRAVRVLIDVTREVNFQMAQASAQLSGVRVSAMETPMISPGTSGSRTEITAEEIESLPVTSAAGVLALQPGFLMVPLENTDVTSFVDEKRGVTSVRIRGGRSGETVTLIDGIPVNNFVLSGPALDFTTLAIQQIDYQRGGFEAQYGNAMSGVVNYATKEGSETLKGSLKYATSRAAGEMGSVSDSVRGTDIIEGVVTGPVPYTARRMRWMLAGRQNTGAHRALEFDQRTYDPFFNPADPRGNTSQAFDLFKGWRPVGFRAQRDLYAKVTAVITPTLRLNVGGIDYERQYQDYSSFWVLTGYDMPTACTALYPDQQDFCERTYGPGRPQRWEEIANGNAASFNTNRYTIQGSTRRRSNLAWAKLSQTLGRTTWSMAGGRLYTARNACNYLTGLCLGDKIRNYTTAQSFVRGRFLSTTTVANTPYLNPGAGGENFAGGDTNTTYSIRGDVQSQVTDHHSVQFGGFLQRHNIRFFEAKNVSRPVDGSRIGNYTYAGVPWDAALYVQDKIEYDFLTVKFGMRFDYTRAKGRFFNNPLDPTNGTTAFEVCQGEAFGTQPYTLTLPDSRVITGIAACNLEQTLMDSARRVAFQDDFGDAPIRTQFSPRIGVNFPINERSSFFANWGVYTQNPVYNAMYQGTGIGRVADSATFNYVTRDSIARGQLLEGTPGGPNFRTDLGVIPLLGNPRLEIERTSSYEIGFLSEIGRMYSLRFTGYTKDQSGLTGIRRGGQRADGTTVLDVGETYGSTTLNYNVLVNTDFQTVRGVEVLFSRRLLNFWAYDVKYAFQQVFTNAAPPDLEIQKIIEGDIVVNKEVRSEIDQPHLFTGVLRFEASDQAPPIRFGSWLRNSRLTFTSHAASGFPYTPCRTFNCPTADRGERNSGTGPMTWSVDMLAEKRWKLGNISYGAYVSISNLLDRKNCLQPYPTTGQCDAGSLNIFRSIAGPYLNNSNPIGSIITQGATTTQFDHPELFGERRSILSGLRVSF